MKLVKYFIWTIALCITNYVFACPQNANKEEFLKFRNAFIEASLKGKAEGVVGFYKFPLMGGGLTKDDRVLKISEKTFMKYYNVLFVKTSMNGAPRIFRNLTEFRELGPGALAGKVLADGCFNEFTLKHGINDIDYGYSFINGEWKVTLVGFGDGYEDAVYELKSHHIKPW
jgi:hypothetical protein